MVLVKLAHKYGNRLLHLKQYIDETGQIDDLGLSPWTLDVSEDSGVMTTLQFSGFASTTQFAKAGFTHTRLSCQVDLDGPVRGVNEARHDWNPGPDVLLERDRAESVCSARRRSIL